MPISLTITPLIVDLLVGEQVQLTVLPSPNGVKWSCSACDIASVTKQGLVTGLAEGTAIITGRRGNVSISVSVTVSNVDPPDPPPPAPPIVRLVALSGSTEADAWIFGTDGTAPAAGDVITSSQIDFGDGSAVIPYPGAPPHDIVHNGWPSPGVFNVRLTVFTQLGTSGFVELPVEVLAVPSPPDPEPPPPLQSPIVTVAFISGQYTQQPVTLATTAEDPDGVVVSHTINYGDSTSITAAGAPPAVLTHTYQLPGTYAVTVTATDNDGWIGSASVNVTVVQQPTVNQPPEPHLVQLSGAFVNDSFAFSTVGTFDPDGTIIAWSFQPGNGAVQSNSGPPPATLTAVYSIIGTYTARLTVTDNSGESRTASVLVNVIAVPPPGTYQYFTSMVNRPQRVGAWTLRNQLELDDLVKLSPSVFWTYQYPFDSYPTPQDAAKLFKPPRNTFSSYSQFASYGDSGDEGVPSNRALRIPYGISSGSLFITYDMWWGQEFQTNKGTANAFKVWLAFVGSVPGGAAKINQVLHERLTGAPISGNAVSRHHDDSEGTQLPLAEGVVRVDPYDPTGQGAAASGTFLIYYARWTRYWIEIKLDQPASAFTEWNAANGVTLTGGPYDMTSIWIADEVRPRARVLYRVPFKRKLQSSGIQYPMHTEWRFSWDCSTNNLTPGTGLAGPVIAYARNVVVLHNLPVSESDSSLWIQPPT